MKLYYLRSITLEDVKRLLRKAIGIALDSGQRRGFGLPVHAMFLLLAVATAVIVNATFGDSSRTTVKPSALDIMKENQIKLYDALRQFVLPDVDYTSKMHERLILQVPGKLLNPMDYYPGEEYEEVMNDPDHGSYDAEIDFPQQVLERMFHLSDVVPGAHPLTGGDNGLRLAKLYENILVNLYQIGFDDLSEDGKHLYNEALDKLVTPMLDPDNPEKQVSLFQLYTRYQEAYHSERQTMELTISEKKSDLRPIEYQHWFERNYSILDAQVETAYRRWLIYGQKHLVESLIAHLDVASSGKMLDKAHVAFRLSELGAQLQDRFEMVYQVDFSPSNWFRHLNTSHEVPLTRDQLQAKLGDVESRIAFLEALSEKSAAEVEETMMNLVKQERSKRQELLLREVQELEDTRRSCWLAFDSVCEYWRKEEKVIDALYESTAANFKAEMLEWQFGENSSLKDQIQAALVKLRNESESLQTELVTSARSLASPLANDMGNIETLSLKEVHDQWRYFEFSSAKVASASSRASEAPEYVKGANVSLKAKLLKVKINRPWFKPTLFHNRELKMRKSEKPVSPGYMSEKEFYEEVTRNTLDGHPYLLYQYSTALLLAKDITMAFTGLSDKTKQAALASSFGPLSEGNFGPITFGGSVADSGWYNHMQASSTANGLKVYIPGAQIIGYYCDVIPKFPNPYNLTELSSS